MDLISVQETATYKHFSLFRVIMAQCSFIIYAMPSESEAYKQNLKKE